jgi:hypothetical protein
LCVKRQLGSPGALVVLHLTLKVLHKEALRKLSLVLVHHLNLQDFVNLANNEGKLLVPSRIGS